jgi:hypothetical protein
MTTLPYLKPEYKRTFFLEWQLFENAHGCTPVHHRELCLQMQKSPPALPQPAGQAIAKSAAAPVAPAAPPPPPPPKEAARAFLEWMIERKEKKQAQAQAPTQAPSQPQRPLPKLFDLYDIPAAMKAAGFPVSAQLAQKWLDGPAYTAYGTDEPGNAKEQRYPKDKVNLNTVSLSWLRGYPKIEQRYQALLGKLSSGPAQKVLRDKFTAHLATHPGMSHELHTREHCQGDWQSVHEQFQFQFEHVGMLDTLTDTLGMTDVTAALANFAFYASVARAHVKTVVYNRYNTPAGTQRCFKSTVQVTHAWVYAKDSYSFHDSGPSSQYLGHWNKNGVIVLPAAVAASVGMKKIADASKGIYSYEFQKKLIQWLNSKRIEPWDSEVSLFPVDIGGSLLEKDIYFPVRNRDYHLWRKAKDRGGDFLIMTQPKLIKLDQPIKLDMPEVSK